MQEPESMNTNKDEQREAFERWYTRRHPNPVHDNSTWANAAKADDWEVWQAAIQTAAPGSPASTQTVERDWELSCDECNGAGHVFVERQVAERKTDVQEFKEECPHCDGRGFTIAFDDIPGIAEYVKSCRPAPAAGDALVLPNLNADLIDILGRPNFTCIRIAQLLRLGGVEIATKAEAEQATVIHYLLGFYLKHGSQWTEKANEDLNRRRDAAIAASQQGGE
jgi:hypothetical protein